MENKLTFNYTLELTIESEDDMPMILKCMVRPENLNLQPTMTMLSLPAEDNEIPNVIGSYDIAEAPVISTICDDYEFKKPTFSVINYTADDYGDSIQINDGKL